MKNLENSINNLAITRQDQMPLPETGKNVAPNTIEDYHLCHCVRPILILVRYRIFVSNQPEAANPAINTILNSQRQNMNTKFDQNRIIPETSPQRVTAQSAA